MSTTKKRTSLAARYLRQFGRDEDGSIIVLTLLLIVMMLVMGGMAVDFMRFESRRAVIQSVSDRAVLAAAELDQTLDRSEVVIDYFEKAGFGDNIVGTPQISGNGSSSTSVTVNAELELDTFYLRLIGIDQLTAPAQATAREGTVEISMVLDISGSMYQMVGGTGKRRYELLQEATVAFFDELLVEKNENQISISLIPYSEHVNIGPEIYNAINTQSTSVVDISVAVDDDAVAFGTNTALCVEMSDSELTDPTFNTGYVYPQVKNGQFNPWGFGGWEGTPGNRDVQNPAVDQPLCPNGLSERIIPITQNKYQLIEAVTGRTADGLSDVPGDGLLPRGGTAIYQGMKWGVTLLDPSFSSVISGISSIESTFRNTRPGAYPQNTPASDAAKYIVLMTDGQNSDSFRIEDDRYDTANEVDIWNNYNFRYLEWRGDEDDSTPGSTEDLEYQRFSAAGFEEGGYNTVLNRMQRKTGDYTYTSTDGDALMQTMCQKAKDMDIAIFAVAMAAGAHGEEEMKKCATSREKPYYIQTDGTDLEEVFLEIAKQIDSLRLSQ